MRYIRTKDGIYELTEWQCDLSNEMFLVKANNKFGNDKVFARDIIKQADAIEELCDAFVFHDLEIGKREVFSMPLPLQKNAEINVDYEQFGAIWTDKGLQFVARMNSEGALELL